jgi:hypothetical protein
MKKMIGHGCSSSCACVCSFERPSAIQQRAIVPCCKGVDVIAQAQSGTGKTATFTISVLQSIDMSLKHTQALILGPTRELAQQIQKVCWGTIIDMLARHADDDGWFAGDILDRKMTVTHGWLTPASRLRNVWAKF